MYGKTNTDILEKLNLTRGQEITLLELDDIVEKYVNDDEKPTFLSEYSYDEILEWEEYYFYPYENDQYRDTIYFEVVENTDDENSIIRIK